MCYVETYVPFIVTSSENSAVESKFHAGVTDVTDIVIITAGAGRTRHGEIEEQIGSLFGIEIKRSGETVPEQPPFDTGIEVGCGLPRNIRVSHSGERRNHSHAVGGRYQIVHIGIGVACNVVVTLLPDADFGFQDINESDIIQELLAVEEPSASDRPEITPTVLFQEP